MEIDADGADGQTEACLSMRPRLHARTLDFSPMRAGRGDWFGRRYGHGARRVERREQPEMRAGPAPGLPFVERDELIAGPSWDASIPLAYVDARACPISVLPSALAQGGHWRGPAVARPLSRTPRRGRSWKL